MGSIIGGAAKAIGGGGGGKGGGKGGDAGGGAMDLVSKLAGSLTGGKGGKGSKGAEAGGGTEKAKKSAKKQKKKAAKEAKKAQEAQKAQQVNKTANPQIAQGPGNVPGSNLNQFFSGGTFNPSAGGGPDLIDGLSKNFGV